MNSDAILLFDFDGTVCLDDVPVRDYARRVVAHLDSQSARHFMTSLEAYLVGKPTTASTFDATDPYHAVRRLAAEHGLDEDTYRACWRATRAGMASGEVEVASPEGLREFLWSLPGGIETVLVTNSPSDTMEDIVHNLKLEGLFDEVIGDAGKPAGMGAIIDAKLDGREPSSLLSIGDIPRNDLIPAAERGCATAYIDHFGRPWPEADVSGANLGEIYPFIHRWASERVS